MQHVGMVFVLCRPGGGGNVGKLLFRLLGAVQVRARILPRESIIESTRDGCPHPVQVCVLVLFKNYADSGVDGKTGPKHTHIQRLTEPRAQTEANSTLMIT